MVNLENLDQILSSTFDVLAYEMKWTNSCLIQKLSWIIAIYEKNSFYWKCEFVKYRTVSYFDISLV